MDKNPARTAFAAGIQTEFIFGQVLIQRKERGFELRHAADRARDAAQLRLLEEKDLRPLAQFTARKTYRPLKSAPTLARGWRACAGDDDALGTALDHLYPGAVADWLAARASPAPVTNYREFTERQTGMYRVTTHLDDATAGAMIRACCHADFCLKRRDWTVGGLAPDAPAAKSVIPCLEPCAILLEFARKIARLEQEDKPPMTPAAAEIALKTPDLSGAEGDFDAPGNPRRARFVLEKARAPVKLQSGK